jgi:sulfite reductase (NADPH) hemoprotein beta-component
LEIYLRNVPKAEVSKVTNALFDFYAMNKLPEEGRDGGMGYFFKRVGAKKIIEYLKNNPKIMHLMKPMKSPLPPRKTSTAIEPF